ncbi:MAG: iron complex outermembrane receptor protein [Arenicella sp.]|jgi:iron complex outermembrane receptor protein
MNLVVPDYSARILRTSLNIAALNLLLGYSVSLYAAPDTAELDDSIEELAVIGTRSETPLSDLPANIFVLGRDDLQVISATHIQQALSQVPGVSYQRGNGQESLPSIRSAVLTGAGACGNVLVLEDGIAVRGAGFCNINELFDTHFEQADRIEVVRGSNTAFYGSNALLGSINVNLPSLVENRVALELGANQYRRVRAAIGYGDSLATHGGFYLTAADDGGFRDESGYQQQKFSWRHASAVGDWHVDLGATITRLDQQTAGFVVGLDSYRDPDLREQNLDPEAFRKTDSLRAWASFKRQLSAKTSLKITPYIRLTDMDFLQHFLPGDPLEQNKQSGIGWQSSITTEVSDTFEWSVGFDGEVADGELLQTQDLATQGSAFLRATIPSGTHYDYQVDALQLGVFGHLRWQPIERLSIIAGLRLERIEYDYDNRGLDGRTRDDGTQCGFGGCRYSRPADRDDSFTHASPKLELQYQVNDNWRLHMAVADSYRAPQATELYRLQRRQTVADLDEVRATHFEVGSAWSNAKSQLDITVYQIEQRNVIIRDSDFFNVDGQIIDSQGLELAFKHQFSDAWSGRMVGAYAKHEYASDQLLGGSNIRGNEVDTAPNLLGSLFLAWRPSSKFFAELELQHLSEYFLEPENQREYPGHTLLNLRGQYQIDEQWSAALRLLNVSDKLYAERADFTSFTNERYFPGEPRSLFAELSWKF